MRCDHRARPLVAVLGPTGCGKSALAERLAEQRDAELVSADASTFYRGLEVGVTKPPPATRQRVRYHLLDVVELSETFTVVDYQRLAQAALEEIANRNRLPILVGGSSLYVKALLEGYVPPDIVVCEAIRDWVRRLPREQAVEELRRVDPAYLARIDALNPRRVSRALELVLSHGAPVPEPSRRPLAGWQVLRLILWPEKGVLEARIRRRTAEMWDAWQEEVLELEKNGLLPWLDVRKPIGYATVLAHLQGRLGRDEGIEEVARATILLAKKQRTWLQKDREGPDRHHWVLAAEADWGTLPGQALALLDRFLARFTQ